MVNSDNDFLIFLLYFIYCFKTKKIFPTQNKDKKINNTWYVLLQLKNFWLQFLILILRILYTFQFTSERWTVKNYTITLFTKSCILWRHRFNDSNVFFRFEYQIRIFSTPWLRMIWKKTNNIFYKRSRKKTNWIGNGDGMLILPLLWWILRSA